MFAGNRDGGGTAFAATGMGLKSDALTPVQKESLKSILISYKCKMSEIHDFYLNNQNSITKDLKADFYQQGYSLSFILQKYHEKDPSLLLEDYIQEAERIRDHQLYKTKQSQKKFNIMPKLTKEKYEQYIEYEKDTRFPQARKPIALNSGARMPESSSLTKSQLNQKPGFNGFGNVNNNNNTNQFANNSNGIQQIGQNYNRPGSFQNGDAIPNGAPNNQQSNVGFSARFNSNNGQNSTNDYNNGQQQSNNYPNSNGYNKPRNSQEEGGYGQNNSYRAGNSYNNNMGFARNRYQNNNRYNSRGRDPIEEEEDEKNNQGAGGFKTAQEQKYQNQYLKRQKEDGFYNKESGRYGRNNGQLDLEGVNDYKPKQYGGYNNRYNNNNKNETGVDDVVSLVHSHALGKKINLNNNESSSNTTAALNGGGTEDEKKAGLNKKFKPPGAPGTNPPAGKKNDPNDQLKGMDQKLVDMIESEIVQNAADVKWDDIAGLNSAKRSVHETIVWPMLNPLLFTGIRAPPKGLLLFGPPGTGKTMIGKAIACESGSTFFSISASSLTSKYIGEGEKMVKILFKLALQRQPSVIFIDEIDSLLCARQENENEASRRIKTEFLVQMEGTTSKGDERILLIGATNRPSELDDAVRRRFVKKLYIPLPNKEAREQLIRRVIDRESAEGNAFDLNPEEISEVVVATKGYSGADMSNLCREAALIPIRQCTDIQKIQSRSDIRPINKTDFMQSLRQVKATVTKKDLNGYYEWNQEFGSFDLNMEEIDS